jgi:FkbM family methyltransferase
MALRQRKLAVNGIVLDVNLETVSYGVRSGTWTIYPQAIGAGSVVYSFGVGKNIEWDLAMIENHRVELHAFDPTPRSVDWIRSIDLPDLFQFHPIGLSDNDGEIEFFVPAREHKVNFSSHKSRSPDNPTVKCPVRRIATLMNDLGHQRLDIVKMDIEGAEIEAIPDLLQSSILPGQLLVEFHYNYPAISFQLFASLIAKLRSHGYLIFDISERGYEFSLIHRSIVNQATIAGPDY